MLTPGDYGSSTLSLVILVILAVLVILVVVVVVVAKVDVHRTTDSRAEAFEDPGLLVVATM